MVLAGAVVAEACEEGMYLIPDAVTLSSVQSLEIAGDAHAQAQLGAAYLHGQGVEINTDKAISLLAKSAAGGDSNGQYLLGEYYAVNGKTEEDFQKAAGWLQQSADQGCLPALFGLGILTKRGKGVQKNTVDGLQMISKAAEAGYTQAQWWLGSILVTGDGVSKDTKAGFNWIKRAADTGDSAAEISLANLYLLGTGIQPNPEAALSLLETVYAKNDNQAPTAAYFLGWMYMEGKGVPVDTIKAFSWMIIAANAHVSDSVQRLKTLTEQLPKQKLITACGVYMDPLFASNNAEEYIHVNNGETVAVLSARTVTDMVYLPDRGLVGFIPRHCLIDEKNRLPGLRGQNPMNEN